MTERWSPTESLEERLKRWLIPSRLYIRYLHAKNLRKDEAELGLVPYLASPDKASVDVGANKGVYSYAMAKYSASVHAFEPNPKMFEILKRWSAGRVQCRQLALGNFSGTAELLVQKGSHGYSNQAATLNPYAVKDREFGGLGVEVDRLDNLGLTGVGFIKIDVEGHEFEVLDGARNTILRDRPNLLIEIEERHTGRPLKDMLQEVCDYGYRVVNLTKEGVLHVVDLDQLDARAISNNFIFLPAPMGE